MRVLIVGGGVVGAAAAYTLSRRGLEVLLLEREEIGQGCSRANAGLIVPSYCLPLASPEALRQGLRWLLDRRSPLRLRPRPDAAFLSWLLRFLPACRRRRVEASTAVLRRLSLESLRLLRELPGHGGQAFDYQELGWLYVFRTPRGLERHLHHARQAEQVGVSLRRLSAREVLELEPGLTPGLAGGVHYTEDAHLDPFRLTGFLARGARQAGARLRSGLPVEGLRAEGGRVVAAQTPEGLMRADRFILAGGAWSASLLRPLGLRLPLEPAKGYSLTLRRPAGSPARPLLLGEAQVVATPMGSQLRLTGGLELVGFDGSLSPLRLELLRSAARAFLPGLDGLGEAEAWYGYRPLTPDSLPVIGPIRRYPNLLLATGHGTLGVTQALATARLLAGMLEGGEPSPEAEAVSPARFGL